MCNRGVVISKMAAVVMETEIMWKIGKCSKMNETLWKCDLACENLQSNFGIFKMAVVAIETVQTWKFVKYFILSET